MTLRQVCTQILNLSVNNNINGEKFTIKRFVNQVFHAYRGTLTGGNKYVFTVTLPDGEWWCYIIKYGPQADNYDYYIPDTREQEKRVKRILFGNNA